ncbi:hypothetical protein PFISCL1PPCAC_11342, partial [Pristionchus fissidentatus]
PSRDVAEKPQEKAFVTGVADNSDECFSRYANVIIVNAQPYERRSRTSLAECKQQCMVSQRPVYACNSFVYDNVNQVCDLFAHAGDAAPARLLKFQTRDYFEPNFSEKCELESRLPNVPSTTTPPVIAQASNTDEREGDGNSPDKLVVPPTQEPADELAPQGTSCPAGKVSRFLRTEGFELYQSDDEVVEGVTEEECIKQCETNKIGEAPLACRSFDFTKSQCSFSAEAAVPLGNGQLKQNKASAYYEKLCVEENLVRSCETVFTRFPQMILVGFAETVTDSATFETCFERCLNSLELFGFNCTSGMYYFEEQQLNCILNTESRRTQGDLFSEENTDIVDYFEISCGERTPTPPAKARGSKTLNFATQRSQNLVLAPSTNTAWSTCENGRQHRRIDCQRGMEESSCGLQSRLCNEESRASISMSSEVRRSPTLRKVNNQSRTLQSMTASWFLQAVMYHHNANAGFRCAPGKCCAVLGGCDVGLMENPVTKKMEWCRNPC